jgi:hypothetical protein
MHALPPPTRSALVPNAIAFRDPAHGLLGGGWTSCSTGGFGCRPQGTIQLTSDGGRTWRVALRTPRPVVWVAYGDDGTMRVRFDDGANRVSADGGRHWRPVTAPAPRFSPCPPALGATTLSGAWALCTGQGSAGSMAKAVYRLDADGWKRVAYTPWGPRGYGGISGYGYPLGIAMAADGFGVIWESRGTLYVTRNGGRRWTALPNVARPEIDFGFSAAALPHGIAYVLLSDQGTERRRLVVTRDGGRSWAVAYRWR